MKKLKTGDVKRFLTAKCPIIGGDKWCIVYPHTFPPFGCKTREMARDERVDWWPGQRIARILSIGPKYVTVRISK